MKEHITQVQKAEKARAKKRYDDKFATDVHYNVGEKVWLNVMAYKKGTCKKLEPKWKGPYVITSRRGNVNYTIKLLNSNKPEEIVHQSRLKCAYILDDEDETVIEEEDEDQYDSMSELVDDDNLVTVRIPEATAQPPSQAPQPQLATTLSDDSEWESVPAPPRLAKPPLLLPAQLPAMLRPPNRPSKSESERASEALHTPARHSYYIT